MSYGRGLEKFKLFVLPLFVGPRCYGTESASLFSLSFIYVYSYYSYAEVMLQVLLYSCSLAKFKGVVSKSSPNKPWILWQFNSNAHLSQILSEKDATLCGWCVDWPSSFRMIVLMDIHWYAKLLSCLSPFILKDFLLLDRWSLNHWTYNTPRTGGLSVLSFLCPLIFPFLMAFLSCMELVWFGCFSLHFN